MGTNLKYDSKKRRQLHSSVENYMNTKKTQFRMNTIIAFSIIKWKQEQAVDRFGCFNNTRFTKNIQYMFITIIIIIPSLSLFSKVESFKKYR